MKIILKLEINRGVLVSALEWHPSDSKFVPRQMQRLTRIQKKNNNDKVTAADRRCETNFNIGIISVNKKLNSG